MKRLLLLFAAILMASTGLWAETVDYLYPVYNTAGVPTSGIKEWKSDEVEATEITSTSATLATGWYVVKGSDVQTGTLICNGEVHLILADGAKLTATGGTEQAGIQVSGEGNSLTVYGQTKQTGQLIANGGACAASIGGKAYAAGSNITINGGWVTASGSFNAAGIGGGDFGSGSNITINGGAVTAIGKAGAGIGGGNNGSGSNITINGGMVTARGSAAGIGGGLYSSGSDITINGGTVTATGGNGSSGVGSGALATTENSSNIFVATKCAVKAGESENPTAVIAANRTATTDIASELADYRYVTINDYGFCAVFYGDHITVSPAFTSGAEIEAGTQVTFTAADRTADSYVFLGFYKERSFSTPITTGVNGSTYTVTVTDAISVYAKYEFVSSYVYPVYNDPNDVTKGIEKWESGKVNAIEVTSSNELITWGEAGKTTWYVVTGADVTLSQGAVCAGNVNLILADGAKLIVNGQSGQAGIQVSGTGNSLTIYGQSNQSGQLEAMGGESGAGIGGGSRGTGSNIAINGGTVTANGGLYGAGIGGGASGSGSNITINGGTVTANGCDVFGLTTTAGIGGGNYGSGSNIKVATTLLVKADGNNPPTTEIDNDGGDIAGKLDLKPHATITSILPFRDAAIAAIDAAIEGVTNENIKAIATTAKTNIQSATTTSGINSIKEKALADLQNALAIYNDGKADAFGTLSEKQNGPALIVTDKDDNEIILYSPKSVEYIKVNEK